MTTPVHAAAALAIVFVSMAGAVWDWRTTRIPNALTLPALAGGLAYGALHGSLVSSVAGVVLAGGTYAFLAARFGAFGGGDVKLVAALGAWGGLPFTLPFLAMTWVVAGVQALWVARHPIAAAAVAVVSGRGVAGAIETLEAMLPRGKTVPHGPAITAGAIAALVLPALPGPWGEWGRAVYAVLAAAVS